MNIEEEIDFIYKLLWRWKEEENAVWKIHLGDNYITLYGPLSLEIDFHPSCKEEELEKLKKIERLIKKLGGDKLDGNGGY